MKASNIFFGILLIVLFTVMHIPSFRADLGYGIGFDIPNPLHIIFDSFPLFVIPVLNFGITVADIILVIGIVMLISGLR